ncbi:MAG: cupin domain-containing protein [Thermoplasmata archaeon]|nr:cupin domain-containing protein [Thermoplasmata archaeon]
MYHNNINNVKKEKVEMEGAVGAWIQWLITKERGAANYAMRLFTIEPDGKIPRHQHPWEHEIFVLEGTGIIGCCEEEKEVKEGDFLYIEPDVPHWYRNNGDKPWKFLCIIPYKD